MERPGDAIDGLIDQVAHLARRSDSTSGKTFASVEHRRLALSGMLYLLTRAGEARLGTPDWS